MKKIMLFFVLLFLVIGTTLNAQITSETEPGNTTGNTGTVQFTYGGSTVAYTTVRAADGRIWLQQNLGSTQVATSRTDTKSFGDLFNWGRWDDGHHYRDNTLINLATADGGAPSPNNPTVLNGSNPFYWSATSSKWWWAAGVSTDKVEATSAAEVSDTNGCDPCRKLMGGSWRMPTITEWEAARVAESITDAYTAFSSHLIIPSATPRAVQTGALATNNNTTRMWSSTAGGSGGAYVLNLTLTAATTTSNIARGNGFPIRCIKESTTTSSLKNIVSTSKLTAYAMDNYVKLSISGTENEVASIRILSLTGEIIYKSDVRSIDDLKIPLTLNKGLYIASATLSNNENINVKFIK